MKSRKLMHVLWAHTGAIGCIVLTLHLTLLYFDSVVGANIILLLFIQHTKCLDMSVLQM